MHPETRNVNDVIKLLRTHAELALSSTHQIKCNFIRCSTTAIHVLLKDQLRVRIMTMHVLPSHNCGHAGYIKLILKAYMGNTNILYRTSYSVVVVSLSRIVEASDTAFSVATLWLSESASADVAAANPADPSGIGLESGGVGSFVLAWPRLGSMRQGFFSRASTRLWRALKKGFSSVEAAGTARAGDCTPAAASSWSAPLGQLSCVAHLLKQCTGHNTPVLKARTTLS